MEEELWLSHEETQLMGKSWMAECKLKIITREEEAMKQSENVASLIAYVIQTLVTTNDS